MHYFFEALIVGVATAVLGFGISTLLMVVSTPDFSFEKYKFWPLVLVSFFLTGFWLHLIFEWTTLNRLYCRRGYACSQK
jgi:hypothetical protein